VRRLEVLKTTIVHKKNGQENYVSKQKILTGASFMPRRMQAAATSLPMAPGKPFITT
jgi:hypothetical protein